MRSLYCIVFFFQNLAVSNSNLKWVKLHFPTYEHGWKKIFFWSSPFPESFWGSSLVSSWNLWNWNHSLLHTWPTPENFLCVFSNSWFCLWSLLHSSLVSTMSQCLKITKNVAFQFLNFDIFNQFLSGNTIWPQASSFQKTRQNGPFLAFSMKFCLLKM